MAEGTATSSMFARDYLHAHFKEMQLVMHSDMAILEEIVEVIASAFELGSRLLICGNGGSASEASHVAAEYINGMSGFECPSLPAISLTTDTAVITAHANDFDYRSVFSLQVRSIGQSGDVLLCLSTSGTSINILEAIEIAQGLGIKTVLIRGNQLRRETIADLEFVIPTNDTQVAQEVSLILNHFLCKTVLERVIG